MIPLPDGTFRFSPRDLVAYLEGDFAAWCERMDAERNRAAPSDKSGPVNGAPGNGAPGNGGPGSGAAGDVVGKSSTNGSAFHPPAWAVPDEKDEELALAARYGDQHELDYLARLRARFTNLVEIVRNDPDGEARTIAAMQAGAPVIFPAARL